MTKNCSSVQGPAINTFTVLENKNKGKHVTFLLLEYGRLKKNGVSSYAHYNAI